MPVLLLVNICLDLFGVEGLEVDPACSFTASYHPKKDKVLLPQTFNLKIYIMKKK